MMLKAIRNSVLLILAILIVSAVGYLLNKMIPQSTLLSLNSWVTNVWLLLSVVRILVFCGLAFWLFPWWVDKQAIRHDLSDQTVQVLKRRRIWVFGAFVLFELVVAQLPYQLLRG